MTDTRDVVERLHSAAGHFVGLKRHGLTPSYDGLAVTLSEAADEIEALRAEVERLRSLAGSGERFEVWISGDHLDDLQNPTDGSAVIMLRDPDDEDDDFYAPATLILHTGEPS